MSSGQTSARLSSLASCAPLPKVQPSCAGGGIRNAECQPAVKRDHSCMHAWDRKLTSTTRESETERKKQNERQTKTGTEAHRD
eukprot:15450546-Alexandrium_andersonii.AAC.1